MTVVGAIALGVSVAAGVLALRADSRVARWVRVLSGTGARVRGARRGGEDLLVVRVAAACAGALIGSAIGAVVSVGALAVAALAYAGWVGPSVVAERRAADRRRAAERGLVTLVEWTHALVSSGRPPEAAIADVTASGRVDAALRLSLDRVRREYVLGVPMHTALAREATASGVRGLAELAGRLEQARDLGRAGLPLLADLRDDLRAQERARALAAAGAVEGKLTAVMTLCYLPALALLVIVPLFVTLLAGLFGP
ncbi:MAG TPA: type II secretion system F family protein [Candidatus Limnocylindria bacterium]|nr:type II secretion system F family protein [Candidatus Limnocylindria bacterium]